MPEPLLGAIERKTALGSGYKAHAAVESIDFYLHDWENAYTLLGRRIEALRGLREQRAEQKRLGEWPARENGSD